MFLPHRAASIRRIPRQTRRQFLRSTAALGVACVAASPKTTWAKSAVKPLRVGEGVAEITPEKGFVLAGFHYSATNPRVVAGMRQPSFARTLVFELGEVRAAIIALDVLGISASSSKRIRTAAAAKTGIPPDNIRVTATHTHSMPSLSPALLWGGAEEKYVAFAERKATESAAAAVDDLRSAELSIGKATAIGANFNRTAKPWKNESDFDERATDDDRWLDRTLRVLRIERTGGKHLLWHHFSAHPVCFNDRLSGPDWPGLVADRVQEQEGIVPGFLQGHIGDVNPGDGELSIGKPEPTTDAVFKAFNAALQSCEKVHIDDMRWAREEFLIPFDRERFQQELAQYRDAPESCTGGPWVDREFAAAWYERASKWNVDTHNAPVPLSALCLGDLGFLFHTTELYSFYGLDIQRRSPLKHTICVGFSDASSGYVTDPKAYAKGEYAAVTVPKIRQLLPYRPTAGRELADKAVALLQRAADAGKK